MPLTLQAASAQYQVALSRILSDREAVGTELQGLREELARSHAGLAQAQREHARAQASALAQLQDVQGMLQGAQVQLAALKQQRTEDSAECALHTARLNE